jgi:hypothetical protein
MKTLIANSMTAARDLRLLGLHFVVNLLLIGGATLWLIIPDKHAAQLVFTALFALVLVAVAIWLHAGTLSYTSEIDGGMFARFWRGFRHAAAFVVVVAVMVYLATKCAGLDDRMGQISGYVYSKVPSVLRSPVGPDRFEKVGSSVLGIVSYYLIPALLLPFAAAGARFGLGKGMLFGAVNALKNGLYWVWFGILLILGVWIPLQLIDWAPRRTLTVEAVSMVIRFTIAYLLVVLSWLAVAGMLGSLVAADSGPGADVSGKPVPQP